MALIGTIRKNSWILVVVIGLALAGFIIMDMTSAGGLQGGGGQFTLGKVDGQEIDYREFSNTQNVLYSGGGASVFDQRNYLWNFFVEKVLVEKEAEALGMAVGTDELNELQFGNNLSPIIQQRFTNPNTGQVDRNQLSQFRQAIQSNQLTPELNQMWYYQEKEIIKEQLQSKLNNLVAKGIYTPTWMAEMAHHDRNDKVSFEYVQIPFEEADDANVEVNDKDLADYISENRAVYERDEETRKLNMVVFNVIPTAQDSADLYADIEELIPGFETTEDDSLYVETNYGSIEAVYYRASELAPEISDQVPSMEVGEVYGPYLQGAEYRAVKLLDQKAIPDSVRSRHILRRAQDQVQYAQAYNYIDSLKNILEEGTLTFDSLAKTNSEDFVSATAGGDIGFNGRNTNLAKPYNDMIFYQADPGELNIVVTQFGVHLIEVTDQKFTTQDPNYQLAYLIAPIIPSEETQDREFEKVADIVASNRDINALREALSAAGGPEVQESGYVARNDAFLLETGTSQTSRDIIRWAYDGDTDIGAVSPEVYTYEDAVNYFNSKYLIVSLQDILPAGLSTVDAVRDEVTPLVINKKKGEVIASRINGTDLTSIASQFNSQVDSVENTTFSASFIPGLGNEPKVLARAFEMNLNDVSQPIIGNNGVYVIRLTDKLEDVTNANIAQMRTLSASTIRSAIPAGLLEAIKKEVKIRDNRFTFY